MLEFWEAWKRIKNSTYHSHNLLSSCLWMIKETRWDLLHSLSVESECSCDEHLTWRQSVGCAVWEEQNTRNNTVNAPLSWVKLSSPHLIYTETKYKLNGSTSRNAHGSRHRARSFLAPLLSLRAKPVSREGHEALVTWTADQPNRIRVEVNGSAGRKHAVLTGAREDASVRWRPFATRNSRFKLLSSYCFIPSLSVLM